MFLEPRFESRDLLFGAVKGSFLIDLGLRERHRALQFGGARRFILNMSKMRGFQIALQVGDLGLKRLDRKRLLEDALFELPGCRIMLVHRCTRLGQQPLGGFQPRCRGGELFLQLRFAELLRLHRVKVSRLEHRMRRRLLSKRSLRFLQSSLKVVPPVLQLSHVSASFEPLTTNSSILVRSVSFSCVSTLQWSFSSANCRSTN